MSASQQTEKTRNLQVQTLVNRTRMQTCVSVGGRARMGMYLQFDIVIKQMNVFCRDKNQTDRKLIKESL